VTILPLSSYIISYSEHFPLLIISFVPNLPMANAFMTTAKEEVILTQVSMWKNGVMKVTDRAGVCIKWAVKVRRHGITVPLYVGMMVLAGLLWLVTAVWAVQSPAS
jgi:hypothetical protein